MKNLIWTKELSKKFWESVSGTNYLNEQNYSRLNAYDFIELLRPYLKKNGRHLDFGAGEGFIVRALIEEGYPCASYEPWSMSSDVYKSLSANPLYLGELDKDKRLSNFDVIFLIEVIEHIFDDEIPVILNKIHSLLKDDGYFIVSTPNKENLDKHSIYCPTCDHLFHQWQHLRSFSPESLTTLLEEYGFETQVLHQVEFSSTLFHIEELKKCNSFIGEIEKELITLGKQGQHLEGSQILDLVDRMENREKFARPEPFDNIFQQNKSLVLGDASRIVYVGKKKQGSYASKHSVPAQQHTEQPEENFYHQYEWAAAHKPYFMLHYEYNQLNSRQSQLEQQNQQLTDQVQQLTDQNQRLTEQDSHLSEESRKLSENNQQLAAQYQQLMDHDREVVDQNRQLMEQNKTQLEQTGALTSQNQQLVEQVSQLTEQNQQLMDHDREVVDQNHQLMAQYQQLMDHDREVVDQNHQLMAQYQQLMEHDREVVDQNRQLMEQNKTQLEQTGALTSQNQQLVEQVSQLTEQNRQLLGQNREKDENILKLSDQNQQLIGQVQKLTGQSQELIDHVRKMTDQNQQLSEQIRGLKEEHQRKCDQHRELSSQCEQLADNVRQLEAENQRKDEQNLQLTKENSKLSQSYDNVVSSETYALATGIGKSPRLMKILKAMIKLK